MTTCPGCGGTDLTSTPVECGVEIKCNGCGLTMVQQTEDEG